MKESFNILTISEIIIELNNPTTIQSTLQDSEEIKVFSELIETVDAVI